MPSIDSLFAGNTALKDDTTRRSSSVPFAPFLISEIADRISDVAPPREYDRAPANTDEASERPVAHGDTRERARILSDDARSNDYRHEKSAASKESPAPPSEPTHGADRHAPARDETAPRSAGSADRPATASTNSGQPVTSNEPSISETADGGAATVDSGAATAGTDAETTASSTHTSKPETAVSASPTTDAGTPEGAGLETISTDVAPVPVPSTPADAAPSADAAARPISASVPLAAAASDPATHTGKTSQSAGSTTPQNLAGATAPANTETPGKLQLAGFKPSNDDVPGKPSGDVPQVVRDVQSIVARPANAAGTNLVQAQQQSEQAGAQAQTIESGTVASRATPVPSSNAAPLAQNAGQGTPLHLGATPGENAGTAGGQANGQQTGGQNPNNSAGTSGGQIAGTAPDATGTGQASQAAQQFQQTLARGQVEGSARSPALAAGDTAASSRADAPSATLGGPQSTLSADPASRAAAASPSLRQPASPAAQQVSVRLSKAVDNGDSRIRIQLRPEDLGKVEVKLDIGTDGRAKAMILAEKPETLDMLQRDSRALERALQDAGLKTDQGSLSFSLEGRESDEDTRLAGGKSGDRQGGTGNGEADASSASDADEHPIPATAIGLAPDGSVNFLA